MVVVGEEEINLEETCLFEAAAPGLIYKNRFFRFKEHIKRMHLRAIASIREMTIPEPLFGTFVEEALPELARYAEIAKNTVIDHFVTLPFTKELKGVCQLSYLDGELEATLDFLYEKNSIPASAQRLRITDIQPFVGDNSI